MNAEEFKEFLKNGGFSTSQPPQNPFRKDWKKIKDAIEPHYYGEVPEQLKKAFPNEAEEIHKYRKETYQAKTESPIVKAITDLHRLLTTAKHSVNYESDQMREWVDNYRIGDDDLFHFFFKTVLPYRILDPNAVLVAFPTGEGLDEDTERVDVDFKIIQNERVWFNDPDFPLLIYEGVTKKKYSFGVDFAVNGIFEVVTDEFYGKIVNGEFIEIYAHNTGLLPFFTLGGRAVPKFDSYGNTYVVYKSDFTPAVPYLNDAAIYDNQHKSVMLASCFPHRIVEGVQCHVCYGNGFVVDEDYPDERQECGTCQGLGRVSAFSPLGSISLAPEPTLIGDQKIESKDPIRFVSPPIDTINKTGEQSNMALEKAEQVLNINRSLKQAQSGVAKEMDREPEYIEVSKISDDIYMKYNHTLNVIQGLVFMDTDSEISVNAPISFDLKNEVELMAELAASMNGMDASVRYGAYLSFIAQRYAQNKPLKRMAKLTADYTTFMLYTIEERTNMIASGQMTDRDSIEATYAFETILQLWESGKLNLDDSIDQLRPIIDAAIDEKVDDLVSIELEDMDDE